MADSKKYYYVVSLCHSAPHEKYITVWRGKNAGYSLILKDDHIYPENDITEGYHNNQENMIVEKEALEKLAIKAMFEGNEVLRVPNCKAVWDVLGVKPNKKARCLTRNAKYVPVKN
ncbi:MAG: hypothetical protein MUC49_02065 [Raineya sp.]|jgi:hypothetical protein|nr:hypothetical protein [Raineya sp.]